MRKYRSDMQVLGYPNVGNIGVRIDNDTIESPKAFQQFDKCVAAVTSDTLRNNTVCQEFMGEVSPDATWLLMQNRKPKGGSVY